MNKPTITLALLGSVALLLVLWVIPDQGPIDTPAGDGVPGRRAAIGLRGSVPNVDAASAGENAEQSHFLIAMRVLRSDFAPASGAAVEVRSHDSVLGRALADLDGVVQVRCSDPSNDAVEIVVRAQLADEAASASYRTDAGAEADLGTLVLQPASSIELTVVADAQPVANASVSVYSFSSIRQPVDPSTDRVPGWITPAWMLSTDHKGRAAVEGVPAGTVRVVAHDGRGNWAEQRIDHRDEGSTVELELEPTRSLRVEVVDRETRNPLEGIRVTVLSGREIPFRTHGSLPMTGADGIATLNGMPLDTPLAIRLLGPGWIWPFRPREGPLKIAATATRVTFEVGPFIDVALPVSGVTGLVESVVELECDNWAFVPGFRVGVPATGLLAMDKLSIRLARPSFASITARLRDGRVSRFRLLARDGQVTSEPSPIVFSTPRSLIVQARDPATGDAVSDVSIRVFDGSGLPLGQAVMCDDSGIAMLADLPADVVGVAVCLMPDVVPLARQGVFAPRRIVDLRLRDAAIDVPVLRRSSVVLRVHAPGVRGLPPSTHISVRYTPESAQWLSPRGAIFDGAAGTVRWSLRRSVEDSEANNVSSSPPSMVVRISSPGYSTVRQGIDLSVDSSPTQEHEVRLQSAGVLIVRKEILAGARYTIRLERRARDKDRWSHWPEAPEPRTTGSLARRYVGLPPGIYRLHELGADWVSDEIEVVSGRVSRLTWDLTRTGWAEGTVDLPSGVNLEELDVRIEGPRTSGYRVYRRVTDRWFRIQVPGDRPVTLVPVHPSCVPSEVDGRVTLTAPRKGVILKMQLK